MATGAATDASVGALVALPPPSQGPQPLSFAQERLWFLHRLEPDSPFYNINISLAIEGPLDVASLEDALAGVVARHEVLRTVYVQEGGLPVQRVLPAGEAFALQRAGPLHAQAEIDRLAREQARAPFDLVRGPVFRATLAQAMGALDYSLLDPAAQGRP